MKSKKMKYVIIGIAISLIFGGFSAAGLNTGTEKLTLLSPTSLSVSSYRSVHPGGALFLTANPSPVFEGQPFTVTVTVGRTPIKNAWVFFNGEYESTNENGKVTFIAPFLNPGDTERYEITANHNHYDPAEINIMIMNYLKLKIISPRNGESFPERSALKVKVVDQNGHGLAGAIVSAKFGKSTTNGQGIAWLYTPKVIKDKVFAITASKDGYDDIGGSISITVKDKYMKITVTSDPVKEGRPFNVIVKDQDGDPIPGARVKFNGEFRLTNAYGKTHTPFIAPYVPEDTNMNIVISAKFRGYCNVVKTIRVKNIQDPSSPAYIIGTVYAKRGTDIYELESAIVSTKGDWDITNGDGSYLLEVHPEGGPVTFEVTAKHPDYSPKTLRITLKEGEVKILDFVLDYDENCVSKKESISQESAFTSQIAVVGTIFE